MTQLYLDIHGCTGMEKLRNPAKKIEKNQKYC